MIKFQKNKGITIISLVITIIVISIIAGVTLTLGTEQLKEIRIDNFKTNMISIRAKSKVIAEEVNAKVWDVANDEKANKRKELYENEYKMTKTELSGEQSSGLDSAVGTTYESYTLSKETLELMGLSNIENIENYIVVYNTQDYTKLDVVYKDGIQYNDRIYYTLSNIQTELGD